MIVILRLGHRHQRDERVSTHVGLAARALGADGIVYSGEKDEALLASVRDVAARWGGSFSVRYEGAWKSVVKAYKKKKYVICHLTMYGMPVEKKIRTLTKKKNILIIAGSEKVPAEIYQLADYNIAVTNQPHSEVAALAVLLHALGRKKSFPKAQIRIVPQERGKKTINRPPRSRSAGRPLS